MMLDLQSDTVSQTQSQAMAQFVSHHKVGDVVSATVIRSKGTTGDVLLEYGVKAHVDECLDHEAGQRVEWLPEQGTGVHAWALPQDPQARHASGSAMDASLVPKRKQGVSA